MGATITPSNFLDIGCYRVYLARFFVIFRVLFIIEVHGALKQGVLGALEDFMVL